ncbi:hypothetical protein D3C75_1032820 [compost metagenome]
MHIKGFYFEKNSKAFAQHAAKDCDSIYGDSYHIVESEGRIEGIGNNVSLVFNNMDFGSKGANLLTVYGKSPIDKNTLHIQFEGGNGESRQLVEFTHSNGYEERSFELQKVEGLQKVTFIFLPGSNFDFDWFKFS